MLAVLTPKDVQKRLQQRQYLLMREVQEIRSRLKASEWLPRLFRLEQECMLATKEAEESWVETILGELRTGKLKWSSSSIDRDLKRFRGDDTLPISPNVPKPRT